jgi:hypothetical protein
LICVPSLEYKTSDPSGNRENLGSSLVFLLTKRLSNQGTGVQSQAARVLMDQLALRNQAAASSSRMAVISMEEAGSMEALSVSLALGEVSVGGHNTVIE